MEIRQLRYFVAVAAERSFSRAAEKLNIAQPPLSRQVQQLEEEIGVRLLDRGRPLTLTDAGRHFFERVSAVLRELELIESGTRQIGRERLNQIRVGFVASTLYDCLPELLRRFRAAAPEAEIGLNEMTAAEQIEALREGRIDVGFGRLHFEAEDITRQLVRTDRLVLAVPRLHPLASRTGPVALEDLAAHPLIADRRLPGPSYADVLLGLFHARGLAPEVAYEIRDLQTALGLVAAGVGISIVPASARAIARPEVVFLPLAGEGLVLPVLLCHRRGDHTPLLARLRALAAEFADWTGPEAPGAGAEMDRVEPG